MNIFYREWTSGISGLSTHTAQADRLSRQIEHWKSLYMLGKDVIIMGDSNLDAKKWNDSDYDASLKSLGSVVQEHLLEESSYQLVKDFTRSEISRNTVHVAVLITYILMLQ